LCDRIANLTKGIKMKRYVVTFEILSQTNPCKWDWYNIMDIDIATEELTVLDIKEVGDK